MKNKKILLIIVFVLMLFVTSCNEKVEVDDVKPEIIINQDKLHITIEKGSLYNLLNDVTCIDNIDGDITNKIEIITNGFDYNTIGVYEITYRVNDSSNNVSELTRIIEVVEKKIEDKVAPILIPSFSLNEIIQATPSFDLREGIKGIDDVDLDITDKITIEDNSFDSTKVGKYIINYYLKDSSGNEAIPVKREITVVDINSIKLVAHRGGKGAGLENTIDAFKNAIKEGYYGLECDIQLTKDNVLVVYHDLDLKRLANIDVKIKDCEWSFLQNVTLTKKETDNMIYTGKILLFSEYLELVKNSDCVAFIELKETSTKLTIEKMFEEIEKVGLPKDKYVIISNSASIDLLVEIRKQDKDVKLQFVGRTEYEKYMNKCLDNLIDIDLSYTVFDENIELATYFVNAFKDKNLSLNIWVVNKIKDINKYLLLGCDYITTDEILPKELYGDRNHE